LDSRADAHLTAGEWQKALSDAERMLRLEHSDSAVLVKFVALKKLNKDEEARKAFEDTIPRMELECYRAGAYAVLGDKKKMLKELEAYFRKDKHNVVDVKYYFVYFDNYKQDPDFLKLLNKYDPKKQKA